MVPAEVGQSALPLAKEGPSLAFPCTRQGGIPGADLGVRDQRKGTEGPPRELKPTPTPGQGPGTSGGPSLTEADNPRRLQSRYTAGITTSVSRVDVTMPPTIGAAIRFITSEPVP